MSGKIYILAKYKKASFLKTAQIGPVTIIIVFSRFSTQDVIVPLPSSWKRSASIQVLEHNAVVNTSIAAMLRPDLKLRSWQTFNWRKGSPGTVGQL